ncbi:MAG: transcription antitermination factor NusB [Hyphomicrobiaceae bacterium]
MPQGAAKAPVKADGSPAAIEAEIPGLGTRRLAVHLIQSVLWAGRPLDDALADTERRPHFHALEARDRAFAHAIAATVLRRRGSLEMVLAKFIEKPLPDAARIAHAILLAAAAQILVMGTPVHAAINLAVAQCQRERPASRYDKLANAVLRRVARDGPAMLAACDTVVLDTPGWLLASWKAAYGQATARAIAAASLAEAPLDLAVKDAGSAAEWADRLGGRLLAGGSIRLSGDHARVEDLPGFAEGAWWVQDQAAQLPARLLGDVAGLEVADLCAAPGGKTAELAARGAQVTAVDQSARRLERLTANVTRLGLHSRVTVVAADVAQWQPGRQFDAVLLDAPCTATGTIRRHPDILHLKRETDSARLAILQGRLLAAAAALVKPGGQLVYGVCSLEPEEGEGVVAAFLAEHPAFVRVPIVAEDLGGALASQWITAVGDLRTLPCHSVAVGSDSLPALTGMDGFYAARFARS